MATASSLASRRQAACATLLREVRAIHGSEGITDASLAKIKGLLASLAAEGQALFPDEEFALPEAHGRTVFHALARYDAQGHALPADDLQREFTHVDILPTLAEAIGLRWSSHAHRLGLGTSLLAGPGHATLAERDGMAVVNGRLSCRSPLFQRLWMKAV